MDELESETLLVNFNETSEYSNSNELPEGDSIELDFLDTVGDLLELPPVNSQASVGEELPLGETLDVVLLDEEDSNTVLTVTDQEVTGLQFPCVVMSGFMFNSEAQYMLDKFSDGPNLQRLYIQDEEGNVTEAGAFSVSLDSIITCMFIGYKANLYSPDGKKISLTDPEKAYLFFEL